MYNSDLLHDISHDPLHPARFHYMIHYMISCQCMTDACTGNQCMQLTMIRCQCMNYIIPEYISAPSPATAPISCVPRCSRPSFSIKRNEPLA